LSKVGTKLIELDTRKTFVLKSRLPIQPPKMGSIGRRLDLSQKIKQKIGGTTISRDTISDIVKPKSKLDIEML